jgi:23S rRNA (cytidine1920-2'-O)/16S rRNA (cytidine1409-2'-O)-methyltransferase
MPWLSKGSKKLNLVLKRHKIQIYNFVSIDIGSSFGGFIHVLLTLYISKVYAIDVGKNQLNNILRHLYNIQKLEQTHVNSIEQAFFHPKPQIITVDVSFISIHRIFLRMILHISKFSKLHMLIKPQFEILERSHIFNGIVKFQYQIKMTTLNIIYYTKFMFKFKLAHYNISNIINIFKNTEFWVVLYCQKKNGETYDKKMFNCSREQTNKAGSKTQKTKKTPTREM